MITDTDYDIAVVIPAYNRADLIGATLDSVLAQTLPPREVIVVDDGSTDDTAAVVQRYGAAVRYHRIENSGVCCARNVAVSLSTAPWIALCDSDDLWRPDKLESQVRLLRQAPDVEYVFSDFVIVNGPEWEAASKFPQAPEGFWEHGRRIVAPDMWVFDESLYERVLRFQPVFLSTPLLTRRLFTHIGGFNENLGRKKSEDLEFTLRCLQHSPIGAVARPIVGIRKHSNNRSGNYLNTVLGQIEILQYARRHHRPHGKRHAAIIEDEVSRRSAIALEFAFAAGRFDIVRALARSGQLRRRGLKAFVKRAIARMPAAVARPLGFSLVFASQMLREV